jgi:hypothetical protein
MITTTEDEVAVPSADLPPKKREENKKQGPVENFHYRPKAASKPEAPHQPQWRPVDDEC